MVEVKGKGGIVAKIVAHSMSSVTGTELITLELEYPRFIHSELMTHRVFSRNAASSRAIPVERMIENIIANTAMPIHWGKNQPGMQAREECDAFVHLPNVNDASVMGDRYPASRYWAWIVARDNAIEVATAFHKAGYHKQIVNRLLEPFTMMKTIVTSTEWSNWDELRNHEDADPVIHELARCIKEVRELSTIEMLEPGQWHTPYYGKGYWIPVVSDTLSPQGIITEDRDIDVNGVKLSEALVISTSCCAQVSYRRLDDSLEKAQTIFDRLVGSRPLHASPLEHQATPMSKNVSFDVPGVTHYDRNKTYWSGNFKNWIQHRQLRFI